MKTKQILFAIGILIIGLIAGRFLIPSASPEKEQLDSPKSVQADKSTIWTCSMHPQIQQPESGDCPICGMDLIPLENDSDSDEGERTLSMSESSRALADIQTTLVKQGMPQAEIRLLGKLGYDETLEKSLTARFPARIDELLVNFTGIQVRMGDPLAKVYSPELRTAQSELLNAHRSDPDSAYTRAAREKLRLWDLLPEQIDAILEAGEALDHFTLKAPISGVVVEKNVNEGDYLKTGDALFRIVDLSRLWANLEAYESDVAWLSAGQDVAFSVEAFPVESFRGQIVFIEPEVDSKTRTIPVRVDVPNQENRLKPGMLTKATVFAQLGESEDAPALVPSSAVLRTGKRAVIYVEKPDTDRPTYEGREIELGARAGDFFVVASGVEAGERVVTNGAFKIDSALQIKAKPSMMNPKGGAAMVVHNHGGEMEPTNMDGMSVAIDAAAVDAYLQLQTALAADDLEQSKVALKAMMQITGHQGALPDLIHAMLAADSLDAIRRPHFETLSSIVIEAVKADPNAFERELYLMNCPMVYNDRGADWLQDDDKLLNPYFGSMMLRCGEVKGLLTEPEHTKEPEHKH